MALVGYAGRMAVSNWIKHMLIGGNLCERCEINEQKIIDSPPEYSFPPLSPLPHPGPSAKHPCRLVNGNRQLPRFPGIDRL